MISETNPTSKDQQEIPAKNLTHTVYSTLPFIQEEIMAVKLHPFITVTDPFKNG